MPTLQFYRELKEVHCIPSTTDSMTFSIRTWDAASQAAMSLASGNSAHSGQDRFVCVGDEIVVDEEDGCLRGHGTHLVNGKLLATLCGVVERVNKLVLVRPLKNRYEAAQGDVVVGRVTEVAGKRWKVDLSSRQEANLLLSAVNLPGGVQRRRNAEDELRMREVLREGDLLSAEVQAVHLDGGVALHTRSSKYGKLTGGQLVVVPASLVKRQKQHFHTLEPAGIHVVLGCNGLLWVAPFPSRGYGDEEDTDAAAVTQHPAPTQQQLEAVVAAGNAIRALARCYLPIYPASIIAAMELAQSQGVPLHQMLSPDFLTLLVESEASRRQQAGTMA